MHILRRCRYFAILSQAELDYREHWCVESERRNPRSEHIDHLALSDWRKVECWHGLQGIRVLNKLMLILANVIFVTLTPSSAETFVLHVIRTVCVAAVLIVDIMLLPTNIIVEIILVPMNVRRVAASWCIF